MEQIRLGFAICGSFCTFSRILPVLERVADSYKDVTPIVSEHTARLDTRFGKARDFLAKLEEICGRKVVQSIDEAEPIGPKKLLDLLVIAPCTGNTLAKLAHGIADSSVTMAAKSHLRNGRPLVLGISTNDGLSSAAQNIGQLLCRKHVFFVPFGQDDPREKPSSLVSCMEQIPDAIECARRDTQLQPLLIGSPNA